MRKQNLQINISFAAEHEVLVSKGNESGRGMMHEEREEFSLLPCQMKRPLWLQVTSTHDNNWKAKPKVTFDDPDPISTEEKGIFATNCKGCRTAPPFPALHPHSTTLGALDIASNLSFLRSWKVNILPCALQQIKYHVILFELTEKVQVCIPCWKCVLHCNVIFSDVTLPNPGQPDRYIC